MKKKIVKMYFLILVKTIYDETCIQFSIFLTSEQKCYRHKSKIKIKQFLIYMFYI